MKHGLLCLVCCGLFCAGFLSGPGAAAASEPATRAEPALEQSLETAARLLADKRFDAACDAYLDLLRRAPDDDRVDVGLARAAAAAGRWPQAYLAYERLTANYPDHAGLRLEYAAVLTRMGNVEAARQQMEAARRLDPASIGGDDIAKLIRDMRESLDTFRAHGRVAAGAIYDSNMNTAPLHSGVRVGGIPVTLDADSTAKAAGGAYLQGALDLAWRGHPYADWWLVGDVAGYQRWNFRDDCRRDLTFGRAAAGLRYQKDRVLLEVRGKGETILENEDTTWNIGGAELTAVYAFRPDLMGLIRGGAEYREDTRLSARNGLYAWGGPYLRWFFGEAGHSLMIGVKAYAADTSERRYSYRGLEPAATLFLNLPRNFELILSARWHKERYGGPATLLDVADRRDEQFRASTFLIYKLSDRFRLEWGWQYTDNRSDSDLYTYTQHMLMAGAAWNF